MSQLLPYEQSIAEKLEQRPIPDMADLIWTRIEAQLDIDIPTGGGAGQPPPAPRSPLTKGFGFFVVFAAIILTFMIVRRSPAHKEDATPTVVPTTPANNVDSARTPVEISNSNQPARKTVNPRGQVLIPNDSNNTNQLITQPDNPVITPDTSNEAPPQVLLPAPDTVSVAPSQPPPKKPRGVRLSNPDYRIVPNKDSGR